jgi:glycolate oxidase FAD binding subunit
VSGTADRVREAYAAGRRLRIQGSGEWLGAGRPVSADATLSLADDRGIVEYVPGDLTLTARAGTRLSELKAATMAERQWLPLDPWGGDEGTLGATVSTATAGPHSHSMGLPRDAVLGMEFITGSGETIRAGGRVVKNVAGFDLTRLLVGSWGTLGVITEVTVRLRARPQHSRTVGIATPTTRETLDRLGVLLRALPFTPLAAEMASQALVKQLGLGDDTLLLVQVGGNERSVREQLELLAELGESRAMDDAVWPMLRNADRSASATWRWSQLPSLFGDTWRAAEKMTGTIAGTLIHGSPARGVVRVIVPASRTHDAAQLARATEFHGTVAIESLPPEAWELVTSRAASDPLSQSIRRKFDPRGILNAGILDGVP